MRDLRLYRRLFWDHPLFWIALGVPLFMHLSRLPVNSWNVEILIARNIWDGFGYVVGPLDPPALWRPPFAVAFLLPVQMLIHDPQIIYAVFGTLTLVGFLVSVFYLMKFLGGNVAAHFSQLLILTTPAFTMQVSHQLTFLSYLLLFSLITLSIFTTLWSWQRAEWRRDLVVGLCWGVAFLARPEAILLFAATLFTGLIFHRSLAVGRGRAASRLALQTAAFLMIYLPCILIFSGLQKRHDLIGQESLITFYAGARLAVNQTTGDPDAEGYRESVARYGGPEEYRYSLIRFAIAHPGAIYDRISQNIWNFAKLIRSRKVLNILDCLAFLLFGSILALARPPSLPARTLIGYLTILGIASPYALLFHVDARYSLLFVLTLVLWLCVASLVLWTSLAARLRLTGIRDWRIILPTAGLVILCAFELGESMRTARERSVNLLPWRELADSFRSSVGPEGAPVVGYFQPDGEPLVGGDFLWFSYFARTALPWCGSPSCASEVEFPRGRIYSFQGKNPEYLWIPAAKVDTLVGPNARIVLRAVPITGHGPYTLVQVGANVDSRN